MLYLLRYISSLLLILIIFFVICSDFGIYLINSIKKKMGNWCFKKDKKPKHYPTNSSKDNQSSKSSNSKNKELSTYVIAIITNGKIDPFISKYMSAFTKITIKQSPRINCVMSLQNVGLSPGCNLILTQDQRFLDYLHSNPLSNYLTIEIKSHYRHSLFIISIIASPDIDISQKSEKCYFFINNSFNQHAFQSEESFFIPYKEQNPDINNILSLIIFLELGARQIESVNRSPSSKTLLIDLSNLTSGEKVKELSWRNWKPEEENLNSIFRRNTQNIFDSKRSCLKLDIFLNKNQSSRSDLKMVGSQPKKSQPIKQNLEEGRELNNQKLDKRSQKSPKNSNNVIKVMETQQYSIKNSHIPKDIHNETADASFSRELEPNVDIKNNGNNYLSNYAKPINVSPITPDKQNQVKYTNPFDQQDKYISNKVNNNPISPNSNSTIPNDKPTHLLHIRPTMPTKYENRNNCDNENSDIDTVVLHIGQHNKKIRPKKREIQFYGIKNLALTCYVNTSLQLVKRMTRMWEDSELTSDQNKQLFTFLWSQYNDKQNNEALVRTVIKDCGDSDRQGTSFTGDITKVISNLLNKNKSENIIDSKYFLLRVQYEYICKNRMCSQRDKGADNSIHLNPNYLVLNKEAKKLEECINKTIGEEEELECLSCKSLYEKKINKVDFPIYLFVNVQRWKGELQSQISLKSPCSGDRIKYNYKLVGVAIYTGYHYYCYVKGIDNDSWECLDDESCSKSNLSNIINPEKKFLCLYEKCQIILLPNTKITFSIVFQHFIKPNSTKLMRQYEVFIDYRCKSYIQQCLLK